MSRDPELLQERFYSQTPQKDHINITQFFDLIGIWLDLIWINISSDLQPTLCYFLSLLQHPVLLVSSSLKPQAGFNNKKKNLLS